MPFVIDPSATAPTRPTIETGPDDILRATYDPSFAGILLVADFAGLSAPDTPVLDTFENVQLIRFFREDGTEVRSGSPAFATQGKATAYDDEASLGGDQSWYVVGYYADGSATDRSELVTLNLPTQVFASQVWLKSTVNPNLSILAFAANDIPSVSYSARQSSSDVLGSAFPVIAYDEWSAGAADWTFWADSAEKRAQLTSCIMSGPLLLQAHPSVDFVEMYVLASDVSRAYGGSSRQQDQLVSVTFTQIDRPAAEGSGLFVPGHSWQDLQDNSGTWDNVESVYSSWQSILG